MTVHDRWEGIFRPSEVWEEFDRHMLDTFGRRDPECF
jgi:hypothetical protein